MCIRCEWATGVDALYSRYHDEEWGVPIRDDQRLFEMLILEGAQAGLSWVTILRKRENYRKAFDGFDAGKIIHYDQTRIELLMADSGIVRNRLKIGAAVTNARAYLDVKDHHTSFSDFLWAFVGGHTITNSRKRLSDIPASTKESTAMSKSLQKKGFKFVGPTICYAFMQAAGMVNDHTVDCFRYAAVGRGDQNSIQ
ncbi:MAG: DNA-3-methyladenine glycosylase I [Gammaproteobacteria bacterium]|nr:DNA-3-methyladenine glycosylase I [Gammaproteobacteria bacterium]